MPKWMRLALGWALAATFALALSLGAVASVRSRVIQPSLQLPVNTASALAPAATSQTDTTEPTVIRLEPEVADTTTSTIGISGSTTTTPSVSGTTSPTATSTATTAPASATTSTTSTTTSEPQATSTTTTTSVVLETQTSSYALVGGVVTISYSPGVVTFVSAVPQPGYSTDRREIGPDEVRIRFESEDHTSDFRARWSSGELEITKNEEGES